MQHIIPDASELDVVWRKSDRSTGDGNCVEFAPYDGRVVVRHSKAPDGPALVFTRDEISAMFQGVNDGEFNYLIQD